MATEHVLYSTNSIIHNRYYSQKTTWQLETAQPMPWPIYSHTESITLNT